MAPSKKKPVQTAVTAKNETEGKKKRGTNTRKNAQEKPKLKTPKVLRKKLPKPNHESGLPGSNEQAIRPKKGTLLPHNIKIQMANEVLKTILSNKKINPETVSSEASTVNTEVKGKAVEVKTQPKRRGRKKKTVEIKPTVEPEVMPETTAASEDVSVTLPAKVKVTKKRVQKKIVKPVVSKETTAPTVKKPYVRKKKVISDKPGKKSNRLQLKKRNETNEIINNIALEIENNICKTDEIQPVKPPLQNEVSDNSRRTSMSSNCLSWTKDISTSSTTTCLTVKSDDFFRIDNKIPVLEITKVDSKAYVPSVSSSSSSDSDSTSSSSSITSEETRTETKSIPDFNGRSPMLSISSVSKVESNSSPKSQPNKYTDEVDTFEKALKALDKVKLMMNSFNLEILNWIGYPDENDKLNPKMKKIFDQFKPENDIVRLYQQFEEKIIKQKTVESRNVECMTKDNLGILDKCSSTFTEHCDLISHGVESDSKTNSLIQSDDDTHYSDKQDYSDYSFRDKTANQTYPEEDDDVISLFAEGSISGAESYRHSSIVTPVHANQERVSTEEYIPLPVSSQTPQVSYKPSKIHSNYNHDDIPADNHQNGIFKLPNIIQKPNLPQPLTKHNEELKRSFVENNQSNKPILMASVFGQKRVKSVVFKDVCFFNLISMCKRDNCGYPHVQLDALTLRNKLVRLREDVFIREYINIRNWPVLRRLYGMYYVQECFRRELTNILIEMAIDFSKHKTTAEDIALSIEVMETALLHLNKVDLQSCKDLLNYNIKDGVLCDLFMHTIAVTQNFSRFKIVFINLTNFIVEHGKTFSREVAENLVERLSILPFEEPLAKALIIILKNTDACVLQNPRLSQFEEQLLKVNSHLFKELQLFKVQVRAPINADQTMEDEGLVQERYPEAPTQDVPIIEDVTPSPVMPQIFTVTNKYANASSSSSDESNCRHTQNERFGYRDKFKSNGYDWPDKRSGMIRGVKRRFDQRNINLGGQIPKYPRRL